MLIVEEKIISLIPQRHPMVMVHGLVSCNETSAVSTLEIRSDNIFCDEKGFSASGLLENMAQTAALRTGYLLSLQAGTPNKNIPVGVIGSIKNFRLYRHVEIGELIETTVKIEHQVLLATVVKARVECNGKPVAESDLQIFLTADMEQA